jgi:hypothetical protein
VIGDARENRGTIHANHIDITKFSARGDSGYKKVVYALDMLLEALRGDKAKNKKGMCPFCLYNHGGF